MTTKHIVLSIAASLVFWQQPQPPSTYSSAISYHVPEETRAAYETWWNDKGRKLAEGILQEDEDVLGIFLGRVIFGGTVAPEANYYLTTFSKNVPKNHESAFEKISQKLWGKSYESVMREAYPLRKRLGQTLSRSFASAFRVSPEEGDVVRLDHKKITPGRFSDYVQLEQQYQPLRAAQVAAGNMKIWRAWDVVLTAGGDREFDAFTMHVFKDLASSLNWNRDAAALAAKLNPPIDYAGLVSRANDTSKTTYGETRVIVGIVRRK